MRSAPATRFPAFGASTFYAFLCAAFLLSGLNPIRTVAQEDDYNFEDIPSEEPSPIQKALEEELLRTAGEYWTARLNEYKVRIDEMLTPSDLEELNRLRVRWAILVDFGKQKMMEEKSARPLKDGEDEMEMTIDDVAMAKGQELMQIHGAALQLATRYRSGLEKVQGTVMTDLVAFVRVLEQRLSLLAGEYRTKDPADPLAKAPVIEHDYLNEMLGYLESEKGKKDINEVYPLAVEPVVLLYNGMDLRSILGGAPTPIAGNVINLPMADMSALKQNFPNPASSTTTIPYVLAEPSSATMIRIYNAKGDLITELDQGARPNGENSLELDVSNYPSGTYLYHLTAQTPNGPRVYAKTMKVVH